MCNRNTHSGYIHINVEEGIARVLENKNLYRKLILLFLEGKETDAFEGAVRSGDFAAAADLVHNLKGVTGNLSLNTLFGITSKMIPCLRSGVLDENMLREYREAIVSTRREIESWLDQTGENR